MPGGLSARIDAVVRAHFRHEGIEPFGPDLAQRLQRLEARVASRKIEHVDIAAELGAVDSADRGVQPLHADQHFGMGAQAIADRGRDVGSIRAEAALHVGCDHPFRQRQSPVLLPTPAPRAIPSFRKILNHAQRHAGREKLPS